MRKRIEGWLREEGQFARYLKDENANWVILANHPRNQPTTITVFNPLASPGRVVLQMVLNIAEDAQQPFRKMSQRDREAFLLDLRMEANRRPTEFGMVHPDGILQRITVSYEIFEDEMTKGKLFLGMREVYKSLLQMQWFLQTRLGVARGKEDESGIGFR
ncbi:MAG: DUF2299 family protein [Candidatus Acetothermia bacterium]|nr:DUF2299 family protein [Candidatus Acetothermia bacterium]MDH7505792.1 DUF2299 family protein [Candidatus Acetothermia bacterium]